MKNRVYSSFSEAIYDIPNSASIMMMCLTGPGGIPQNLIMALRDRGVKDLTLYPCANFGFMAGARIRPDLKFFVSPSVLLENHQVKRATVTWGRGDADFLNLLQKAAAAGEVEVEFVPLGVYAHRVRAGGSGVGGFYSPVGVDTIYEKNKETRVIDGRKYIFEKPMRAQFGFVRAHKADTLGNMSYEGTAQCFNPLIAKACDITIAEVDEIVEAGELDPKEIVTPGIFIDRIVKIPEGGWK